jgi:uncharacterized protein involved in response to NO
MDRRAGARADTVRRGSALARTSPFRSPRRSGLAVPFVRAGSRRNYFFVGLLVLLAVAAGFIHPTQLGIVAAPPGSASRSRLDVVLFIIARDGGTGDSDVHQQRRAAARQATRHPAVERVALGSVLLLLALDAIG